jgi:mannan endo-1,4-beta-mannosidase
LIRTLLCALSLFPSVASAGALGASVDPATVLGTIPEECYGSNQPIDAPVRLYRHGGNRWTGYNWENNASNAGADWKHISDYWLPTLAGLPGKAGLGPAAVPLAHWEQDQARRAETIFTVPMAGYVAADGDGTPVTQDAPNARWVKVVARKGPPFAASPDLRDGKVYVDEFVHYLVAHAAPSTTGPRYYCLDNEPGIWSMTHPRIHPAPASYAEMIAKSTETAAAVLDQDPGAQILGAVIYGWEEARRLQKAPDADAQNAAYGWYVSYFLDKMRQASEKQKRRLIHYLDFHWYPEARGGGVRITEAGKNVNAAIVQARVQAPRSLWDPKYVEDSWVAMSLSHQPILLIPKLQASIDKYYPGTKLGFSEFSYGGGNHISGAIAVADALGIFGEHQALAAHWSTSPSEEFTAAAYRLYLDYDGKGGRYGDRALKAAADDDTWLSVHAAAYSKVPGRLSILVLSKNQARSVPLALRLPGAAPTKLTAWRLEGSQPVIQPSQGASFKDGVLSDTLPALSATLYIVERP